MPQRPVNHSDKASLFYILDGSYRVHDGGLYRAKNTKGGDVYWSRGTGNIEVAPELLICTIGLLLQFFDETKQQKCTPWDSKALIKFFINKTSSIDWMITYVDLARTMGDQLRIDTDNHQWQGNWVLRYSVDLHFFLKVKGILC